MMAEAVNLPSQPTKAGLLNRGIEALLVFSLRL